MVNKRQKGAKKAPKGPKPPKVKIPKPETSLSDYSQYASEWELFSNRGPVRRGPTHYGGRGATSLINKPMDVDEEEVFQQVNATTACHVEGLGTFLLCRIFERDYYLSLNYSEYNKKTFEERHEAFFNCGPEIKRFIALDRHKLMVEFLDGHPLLIISTKDDWKTLEQRREPVSNLETYLKVDYRTSRSLFSSLRDTGNQDVTIVCDKDVEVDVHSLILAPQWPHFVKTVDLSIPDTHHFMKMFQPAKWVRAMVSFFYDERDPMDLDTACGALVMAKSYDIPDLAALALRTIYAAEMTKEEGLLMWRRVRKCSETAAVYLMNVIKGPDEEEMTYQRAFMDFTMNASFEEKNHFAAHLCPSNAPRPKGM